MALALDKEHLVVGFINRTKDQEQFSLEDVLNFINVLWNIGCGPVVPNFSKEELRDYLDTSCSFILKKSVDDNYYIDRSSIRPRSEVCLAFSDAEQAMRVELLLRLNGRINVSNKLLSVLGYGFLIG